MNIVNITVGVVTTAVKSGLNALRGQFTSLRNFANGELAGALAGGGLIATFDKIIEKAGQITDISERFGVIPESLQEITNAAEPNGASMEDVAAAMNKTAISQEKVRKGNKELRETLAGLKVDTDAFINASPEEAFLMISDAVKNAEDRTMAYGAVLELMGKSSGKLFTTIEQGSAAIKEQGRAVGVMSNDSVAKLDELGDTLTNLKNKAFAGGAEILSFGVKLVQSVAAVIGAEVVMVKDFFDYVKNGFKGNLADVFKGSSESGMAQLKEIWSPEKKEQETGKKNRGAEDLESEIADRTKLQTLYDRLDEKKQAMQADELTGEGKILELMKQRNYLNDDASNETDLLKQAELWDKALDIQKEIMTLREKADADEEKRIERIGQKRSELEDKSLSLEERRAKLQEKLKAEGDEEKQLDLKSNLFDIEKQIKDKNKGGVAVSSIQKIGGGGAAFARSADPNDKLIRAVNDAKQESVKSRVILEKIEKKTGKATWNP